MLAKKTHKRYIEEGKNGVPIFLAALCTSTVKQSNYQLILFACSVIL